MSRYKIAILAGGVGIFLVSLFGIVSFFFNSEIPDQKVVTGVKLAAIDVPISEKSTTLSKDATPKQSLRYAQPVKKEGKGPFLSLVVRGFDKKSIGMRGALSGVPKGAAIALPLDTEDSANISAQLFRAGFEVLVEISSVDMALLSPKALLRRVPHAVGVFFSGVTPKNKTQWEHFVHRCRKKGLFVLSLHAGQIFFVDKDTLLTSSLLKQAAVRMLPALVLEASPGSLKALADLSRRQKKLGVQFVPLTAQKL